MSGKATGWVFEHSPLSGSQLIVHLALADVANDLYENEIWLSMGKLADKARCTRGTALKTCAALVDLGLLELLDAGGGRGKPVRYRLLMPAPETVEESRSLETARSAPETARSRRETARSERDPEAHKDEHKEPKNTTRVGELGIDQQADQIARAWWEGQQPRPISPPFLGARKIVKTALNAGWERAQIEGALAALDGPLAGWKLQQTLERRAKAKPAPNATPAASRSWMTNG